MQWLKTLFFGVLIVSSFFYYCSSDAARRRAEETVTALATTQTAAVEDAVEQERQKLRAEADAQVQSLMEKLKLMEEEAVKYKELIANSEKRINELAPAAAPEPSIVAAPAAAAPLAAAGSPARSLPLEQPEEEMRLAVLESPLVQRSMEDLINDLGGGAFSPDDDEVAGGSLLLIQNQGGTTPLQNLNNTNQVSKHTKVSPLKQNTSPSSIENIEKSLAAGDVMPSAPAPSPLPPSPLKSDPSNGHAAAQIGSEEENTPPAQSDDGNTANDGAGLFTLFRGLASSGGDKDGGDTSGDGDTMMDDNDMKSTISSDAVQVEGREKEEGEEGMEIDVSSGEEAGGQGHHGSGGGGGRGLFRRDSLGLDGPEPFQSQGSMN